MLAVALAAGVVLSGLVAAPARAQEEPPDEELPPVECPDFEGEPAAEDELTAYRYALACGVDVEVLSLRGVDRQVFATPEGLLDARIALEPYWVRDGTGAWVDIDPTLVGQADGSAAAAATVIDVAVGGGGGDPFVTATDPDGGSLSLTWPDGGLAAPVLDGPVATFPEVLPGVDLAVQAEPVGFSWVLVVKTPEAAADPPLGEIEIGIEAVGLTVVETESGLEVVDGYDVAGHTTAIDRDGEVDTLTWDTTGRLDTIETDDGITRFFDDVTGNRVLRADPNGDFTAWVAGYELTYDAATGATQAKRYYQHGDETIGVRNGRGDIQWLASDHHGTNHWVVNGDTLTTKVRRFDPFGNERGAGKGIWPDQRGFVGGITNEDTGLTTIGAREYDPAFGRFLSRDPIADFTDPQQINGYSYASNNPVVFSDPTGLRETECSPGPCHSTGGKGGASGAKKSPGTRKSPGGSSGTGKSTSGRGGKGKNKGPGGYPPRGNRYGSSGPAQKVPKCRRGYRLQRGRDRLHGHDRVRRRSWRSRRERRPVPHLRVVGIGAGRRRVGRRLLRWQVRDRRDERLVLGRR